MGKVVACAKRGSYLWRNEPKLPLTHCRASTQFLALSKDPRIDGRLAIAGLCCLVFTLDRYRADCRGTFNNLFMSIRQKCMHACLYCVFVTLLVGVYLIAHYEPDVFMNRSIFVICVFVTLGWCCNILCTAY